MVWSGVVIHGPSFLSLSDPTFTPHYLLLRPHPCSFTPLTLHPNTHTHTPHFILEFTTFSCSAFFFPIWTVLLCYAYVLTIRLRRIPYLLYRFSFTYMRLPGVLLNIRFFYLCVLPYVIKDNPSFLFPGFFFCIIYSVYDEFRFDLGKTLLY